MENNKVIECVKESLNNIYRKFLIKEYTNNLGKVIEEEDKIICYIKKSTISKQTYPESINCSGISSNNKLIKKFKLDKPVYYIFENLNIKKRVFISGINSGNVIIKNCKFNLGLDVQTNGDIKLEDTYIKDFHRINIYANNVIFDNVTIDNINNSMHPTLNVILMADNELLIKNSCIGNFNQSINIKYSSKRIDLENSETYGDVVKVKAKKFTNDIKSKIHAYNNIENDIEIYNHINILTSLISLNVFEKLKPIEKIEEIKDKSTSIITNTIKRIETNFEERKYKKLIKYDKKLKNIKILEF